MTIRKVERKDILYSHQTHLSPSGVARYMHTEGKNVGRRYKTHGEVWDTDDKVIQTGLLHLILSELEKLNAQPKVQSNLEKHRDWLNHYYPEVVRLITAHRKQCTRIGKFCDITAVTWSPTQDDLGDFDIHSFAEAYRLGYHDYLTLIEKIKRRIYRLKTVKTINDLEKLKGIKKKRADFLRAKQKQLEKERQGET